MCTVVVLTIQSLESPNLKACAGFTANSTRHPNFFQNNNVEKKGSFFDFLGESRA